MTPDRPTIPRKSRQAQLHVESIKSMIESGSVRVVDVKWTSEVTEDGRQRWRLEIEVEERGNESTVPTRS